MDFIDTIGWLIGTMGLLIIIIGQAAQIKRLKHKQAPPNLYVFTMGKEEISHIYPTRELAQKHQAIMKNNHNLNYYIHEVQLDTQGLSIYRIDAFPHYTAIWDDQ